MQINYVRFLLALHKPATVGQTPKQIAIHIENEIAARKFNTLDHPHPQQQQQLQHHQHHHHHGNSHATDDCFQCRRYSAADAVAVSVKSFNQSKLVEDASMGDDPSLKAPTQQQQPVTTSIIKKSSNLKKSNSNYLNKPRLGGEKVKFSDVEFRHLINNDKSLDTEQSTDDKAAVSNAHMYMEPQQQKQQQQQSQTQSHGGQSSLTPRNVKRKKLNSIDQLHYDKLCSLQQLQRPTSSPPTSMNAALIPPPPIHKPRRLKYSNTLSILDLERMRTRSIGREFNPAAYYFMDDFDVANSGRSSVTKENLFRKTSQPIMDEDHLKFYNTRFAFVVLLSVTQKVKSSRTLV